MFSHQCLVVKPRTLPHWQSGGKPPQSQTVYGHTAPRRWRQTSARITAADYLLAVQAAVEAIRALQYRGSEVVVMQILDPAERTFPFDDVATFQDLETGDLVPDLALTDQDGKHFRLSDLRGYVVVLTFIYTRCPLPDYCPRMNAHFAAAVPNLRTFETDVDRIAWDHELYTHVPQFEDGHLLVPDRPGWGTEPNEAALRARAHAAGAR